MLSMVDSVLLLVDANEGPMPQTRYVLMRALRLGLRPIVVINKVDRPNAEPAAALNKTFDLFIELGAHDAQADFPVIYGSALHGWMVRDLETHRAGGAGGACSQMIVDEVPAAPVDREAPFRMQVSTLAWNDHIGRIGCGRVLEGSHRSGRPAGAHLHPLAGPPPPSTASGRSPAPEPARSTHLWVTRAWSAWRWRRSRPGDIVWVSGPEEITIGDTLSAPEIESPGAAAAGDRRADGLHVLPGQHRSARRARGPRADPPPDQGAPGARAAGRTSRCGWRTSGGRTG